MKEYGVFDIIGPVMIGPSSSHTAGAARLGLMAQKIAGDEIGEVVLYLHGSFAKTYAGHGTDMALLGGVLGLSPDDERIRSAFDLAKDRHVKYCFEEADLGEVHPNTVKIVMKTISGEKCKVTGSSLGGGKVRITGSTAWMWNLKESIILLSYPKSKSTAAHINMMQGREDGPNAD